MQNMLLTDEEAKKRACRLTVNNAVEMCLEEIIFLSRARDLRPNILGLAEAKIAIDEGLKILKAWQALDKKKNNSELFALGVQGKIDICNTALSELSKVSIQMPPLEKTGLLAAANAQIESLQGKTSRSDQFRLRLYQEVAKLLKQNPS